MIGNVEWVNGVIELRMPVSGSRPRCASSIHDPETVGNDPYGKGRLLDITVTDPRRLDEQARLRVTHEGMPRRACPSDYR